MGVHSRLDSLQAVLLDIKLKHLNEYLQARIKLANAYDIALSGISGLVLPARAEHSKHVFHQYTLCNPERDALQQFLNAQEIPTMVYYPVPLHVQKPYLDARHPVGGLPISERLSKEVLSLPMHTEMDDEQFEKITTEVTKFYKK